MGLAELPGCFNLIIYSSMEEAGYTALGSSSSSVGRTLFHFHMNKEGGAIFFT